MEMSRRVLSAIPKPQWRCVQCRRASDQSTARFPTKSATATLAEGARSTARRDASPISGKIENAPVARDRTTPKASMMDIAAARARAKVVDKEEDNSKRTRSSNISGLDLERQVTRKFFAGDVYSPHDLGSVEMKKWHRFSPKPRTPLDIVDRLGIDFMREYKNINMMQEFTSSNGLILPARKTGFRAKNQRKMAKAVRRAAGLGLIPKMYAHPEMLLRVRRNM